MTAAASVLRIRRLPLAVLAALALTASAAATAQADIRLQPVRPLDAVEGDAAPRDRIVAFDDAGPCAADQYTIEIGWGDGTTSPGEITFTNPITAIGGEDARCIYQASGAHVYRTAGTYALSARVCRGAECVETGAGRTAAVAEAEIGGEAAALSLVAGTPFAGRVAEFDDRNRLAQASDYAARIEWGDGTTTAGRVTGGDGRFEVAGDHTYAAAGTHALRVTLLQAGADRAVAGQGAVAVAAVQVTVAPAPVGITAASTRPRPALRLRTRTIRLRSLRRGAALRLTLPTRARSIRVALLRIGTRARRLATVTARTRNARTVDGVRIAGAGVVLPRAVRGRMRPGTYALRVGPAAAQFRVTR
jgi:hypothetical protein